MSFALDIPKNQASTLIDTVSGGIKSIAEHASATIAGAFTDTTKPISEYVTNRFSPFAEAKDNWVKKTKEAYSKWDLLSLKGLVSKVAPRTWDPLVGLTSASLKSVVGSVTDLPMKGLELGKSAIKTGLSVFGNYANAYMKAFNVAGGAINTFIKDVNPYTPGSGGEAKGSDKK